MFPKRTALFIAIAATLSTVGLISRAMANEAPVATQKDAETYLKSTTILVDKNFSGDSQMLCTATAFERHGNVYRFVTAAHCVATDDKDNERVEVEEGKAWYLTFDDTPDKDVKYRARIIGVGYQSRRDDFVVLEATIDDREVALVPLAIKNVHVLEPVINVAAPGALAKQVFTGHVSATKLDRPMQQGDINWEGAILLQLGSGGGSSGSAVISLEQKGIVAFLVGHVGKDGVINRVAIPVDRFRKFYARIQAGTYKYFKPVLGDDDEAADCFCKRNADGTINRNECFCRNDGITKKPKKKKEKDAE